MAYLIKHNNPDTGYVSWQNLNMQYNGSSYAIADGYTDRTYVWWELGDPYVLKASNDFPELTAADALVLLNKNGTAMLVPGATILDGALIVPGTILAEALSANSVTGEKILAGEIDTAHLAAGAITADVIAAGAIGAAAIAAGAIQADHLDADVITSDKIVAEAVTAAKIAVNAVTANKIAANAVTSAKIKAGEISANHLAANAVTADKIVAGAVTAAKISVDDLSAISGKFTSLMAGTVNGARLELGEDAGTPFLEAYDSANKRRVSLLQDRLQFFTTTGANAGFIRGEVDGDGKPVTVLDGDLLIRSAQGGVDVYDALLRLYVMVTTLNSMHTLSAYDDLNYYKEPGLLSTGSTSNTGTLYNCPVSVASFIEVLPNWHEDSVTQRLTTVNGDMYVRVYYHSGDNWRAWKKVQMTTV